MSGFRAPSPSPRGTNPHRRPQSARAAAEKRAQKQVQRLQFARVDLEVAVHLPAPPAEGRLADGQSTSYAELNEIKELN